MRAPIGNRRPTIRVDVFAWSTLVYPACTSVHGYMYVLTACVVGGPRYPEHAPQRGPRTQGKHHILGVYTRGRYIPQTWCKPLPLIPPSVMELRPSLLSLNKRTGHGPRRRRSHREEF